MSWYKDMLENPAERKTLLAIILAVVIGTATGLGVGICGSKLINCNCCDEVKKCLCE